MAKVTIEHVNKIFRDDKGNTVRAVDDVCLEINDREFMVLVGPSGCGKSTMLRMVAGLEEITKGMIRIGDRVVNDVPPKDRDIAMVFQNYALYPHMTVHKNMAFGLHLRKRPKVEIESRVKDAADTLHIIELLYRKPKELSGGQRQRVAVGRAIVREPKAFLFDEPLSNLDAKMRGQMRMELSRLHTQLECTMIYVTHDQVEAMTMGDRITVMNNGRIQQVDSPMDVYNQPANMFVAGFIGSPPMNFFQGALQQRDGHMVFCEKNAEGHQPFCVRVDSEHLEKLQKYLGQEVVMGIRPGDICDRLHRPDAEPARVVPSTVEVVEPLGPETYFYMNTGTHSYVARVPSSRKVPVNTRLEMVFDTRKAHFFDKPTTNTIV